MSPICIMIKYAPSKAIIYFRYSGATVRRIEECYAGFNVMSGLIECGSHVQCRQDSSDFEITASN